MTLLCCIVVKSCAIWMPFVIIVLIHGGACDRHVYIFGGQFLADSAGLDVHLIEPSCRIVSLDQCHGISTSVLSESSSGARHA